MPGLCTFSEFWLTKKEFQSWLKKDASNTHNAGGPTKFPITKELLCSASSARQKYETYLNEQRVEQEAHAVSLKRKAVDQELDGLKSKRRQLEKDIDSLNKAADAKAMDAEEQRNMSLIVQSNALRKSAANKRSEKFKLDKIIEEKSKAAV